MRVVLLLSGGLDSTVLATHLLHEGHTVDALGVHYGQTHARELGHAARVATWLGLPYRLLSLPALAAVLPSALTGGGDSKVVPNRNTILLSVAVGYAAAHGAQAVALGCNADDARDFYDCRPEYMDLLRPMAAANGVQLLAPLVDMTKQQVAAMGERLGAPMHLTRSCYHNGPEPCGDCDACHDRQGAFGAVPR